MERKKLDNERVSRETLVVGAGIAGIQAALEIADSEHKVYLVEREPSVGGHMIQLDKTFPTLDCSSCITTPKMSQVGSHKYIELMTYSEVVAVSGHVGHFKVKKKARYVDINKCIGCGLCVTACPYNARKIDEERKVAVVEEVLCQGCGVCVALCPNGAAKLRGLKEKQVFSMIEAAL